MRHVRARLLATTAAALLTTMLAPQVANAESAGDIEEIVVTARRVAERLSDVPLSISAFQGEELARNNNIRLESLNQLSPNINVNIVNGRQASYAIRGLGANPGNDGLEGSTGVFLDGVYLGRPGMAAVDLIDIEQIEVLRGPQGTLFGKNTTAGAINITTAAPQFAPSVKAQVSLGNLDYIQAQGTATGPIGEHIAVRLTGYHTERGGIIDNIYTGKKTNDQARSGLRGQALFKPTDDLSLRLIAEWTRERGSTGGVLVFDNWGLSPAALRAKLAATNAIFAIDPDGRQTAIDGAAYANATSKAISGELNWSLGDFTLTAITAYRDWDYSSLGDNDGTSADMINAGFELTSDQFTQEVRLVFPRMGPVDAIVGAYYFNQKVRTFGRTVYGADAASWLSGVPRAQLAAVAATTPPVAAVLPYNNSEWNTIATPKTDSYAVFGQATWHVTPLWNLTSGLRITREKKTQTVWRPNPWSTLTGLPIPGLAAQTAAPLNSETSDTSPSYLISTDYHLAPDVMVYALVSRGQKAGGINSALPSPILGPASLIVRPEVATSYEAGLKADLLDRRLRLNLSLFRTDVTDYQATYSSLVNNQRVTTLTNVGEVRSQGVEAEAMLNPVSGLTLRAFVGYTDATYRSYPDAPCPVGTTSTTVCDLTGRPLANSPKWTAGLSGAFEHSLGDQATAYVLGDYSYRSSYYGVIDDSPNAVAGDFGVANLRIGVRAPDERWDLSVWGRNLADGRYRTTVFNVSATIPGMYAPGFPGYFDPRTYGVTLRSRF